MAEVVKEPIFIVALCPTCQEPRYRSKVPIATPEDARASNFEPLGGAPEPLEGTMPLCFKCTSTLTFVNEDSLGNARPGRNASVRPVALVPKTGAGIKTLFEVRGDEKIVNVYPSGSNIVVLTTTRVVEVNLGSN